MVHSLPGLVAFMANRVLPKSTGVSAGRQVVEVRGPGSIGCTRSDYVDGLDPRGQVGEEGGSGAGRLHWKRAGGHVEPEACRTAPASDDQGQRHQ